MTTAHLKTRYALSENLNNHRYGLQSYDVLWHKSFTPPLTHSLFQYLTLSQVNLTGNLAGADVGNYLPLTASKSQSLSGMQFLHGPNRQVLTAEQNVRQYETTSLRSNLSTESFQSPTKLFQDNHSTNLYNLYTASLGYWLPTEHLYHFGSKHLFLEQTTSPTLSVAPTSDNLNYDHSNVS